MPRSRAGPWGGSSSRCAPWARAVDGRHGGTLAPLVLRGGGLRGIDYRPPVPSAQVKSAILLAGIGADGETTVRESIPTRAHTEELLERCGADITVTPGAIRVRRSTLQPFALDVPGDPSQAAFWVVAACIVPGSDLVVDHVYVGPGRAGFLDVLRRMGAQVSLEAEDGAQHTASIRARYGPLTATTVGGSEIAGVIDEVPVLAVAAASAEGRTIFRDAAELRVKESDRVDTVAAGLRAFGVDVETFPDGLAVAGRPGGPRRGAAVEAGGDHRVAMAMAVAALAATTPTARSRMGIRRHQLPRLRGGPQALRVIAIDGPAGSGKSTVARAVADRLGLAYLDTGAMYRAVAFAALRRGIDPEDAGLVARLAHHLDLDVAEEVTVDGVNATIEIRGPEVTRAVSTVAANPEVRRELNRRQHEWAEAHHGGVIEGRDIGSVVFPDAAVKVFLTASDDERAVRRSKEVLDMNYDEVAADLARRDRIDSSRAVDPLTVPAAPLSWTPPDRRSTRWWTGSSPWRPRHRSSGEHRLPGRRGSRPHTGRPRGAPAGAVGPGDPADPAPAGLLRRGPGPRLRLLPYLLAGPGGGPGARPPLGALHPGTGPPLQHRHRAPGMREQAAHAVPRQGQPVEAPVVRQPLRRPRRHPGPPGHGRPRRSPALRGRHQVRGARGDLPGGHPAPRAGASRSCTTGPPSSPCALAPPLCPWASAGPRTPCRRGPGCSGPSPSAWSSGLHWPPRPASPAAAPGARHESSLPACGRTCRASSTGRRRRHAGRAVATGGADR